MANPPKKIGQKPAVKTPAAKPAVKSDAVALTASQALKASDQAIGNAPAAKRAYVRKAPVAQPSIAAKPVAAPKPPVVAKPVVAKVEAPVAKVEAAPAAPTPVAAPVVVKAAPAPAPVAAKPAPAAPEPKPAAPEITPPITVGTKEEAAPEAVAPAIPTLAARAEGTVKMSDVIENTKKYTEDAKVRFQSAFSDISAKAKAATEKSTKAVEEITDLTKGNVEALVESGKIAAKGFETFGQDAAEYGRLSFEKATATLKSLAAVKSPTEFFQLQSELLSTTFDGFAKEAAKNSEAFLKLAGDVAQPLSSRVAVVTEKVKSLAA